MVLLAWALTDRRDPDDYLDDIGRQLLTLPALADGLLKGTVGLVLVFLSATRRWGAGLLGGTILALPIDIWAIWR